MNHFTKAILWHAMAAWMSLDSVRLCAAGTERYSIDAEVAWSAKSPSGQILMQCDSVAIKYQYQDGIWEVLASYPNAENGEPKLKSAKRIADGIRTYTIFHGQDPSAIPLAQTCSLPCPPPGFPELFVPWLALTRHPELPTREDGERELFLSIPDCQTELLRDVDNRASIQFVYFREGEWLFESLKLWNLGIYLEIGPENTPIRGRHSAPFDQGFLECEYLVESKTIRNDVAFPTRAIFRRFAPMTGARTSDQLFAVMEARIAVREIRYPVIGDLGDANPRPDRLFALDSRLPALRPGQSLRYLVTNDVWQPRSARSRLEEGR